MNLTLFVTEECQTCERVMSDLKQLAKNNSEVNLHISNIQNANPKNIVIVPALFLGDKLFSYGEFDTTRLKNILNESA